MCVIQDEEEEKRVSPSRSRRFKHRKQEPDTQQLREEDQKSKLKPKSSKSGAGHDGARASTDLRQAKLTFSSSTASTKEKFHVGSGDKNATGVSVHSSRSSNSDAVAGTKQAMGRIKEQKTRTGAGERCKGASAFNVPARLVAAPLQLAASDAPAEGSSSNSKLKFVQASSQDALRSSLPERPTEAKGVYVFMSVP